MTEVMQSGFSRVWTIENLANPQNTPIYQGLMKIGDPTVPFGDITRVEAPSGDSYDEFDEVAEVKGTRDRATFELMGKYPVDVSTLLRIGRQGCPLDVQAHIGKCQHPRDFNQGWVKILVFEHARISEYSAENLGALQTDERASVNETASLSSRDMYEVVRINFTEEAAATVAREIISIDVCDSVVCGECGDTSDGCQKVLAVQLPSGATPGTSPAVVYSKDGGETWAAVNITTLLGNESPTDSECVGGYFVVISNTDESYHIARVSDILDGTPSWQQVSSGFVFGQGPNAIVSTGPNKTWIAADAGYIYFTADPVLGVTVQEAGVLTTQTLNDIDAIDDLNVVAVGNSNAVLVTDNGGVTWRLVTGPAVGINLTAVSVKDANTWLIGTASATLYYTKDAGKNWTQIVLPIGGSRVDDIKFSTRTVGYLSLRVAGSYPRILRTVDGGHSWYVTPEGPGTFPNTAAQRINQVAICDNPNLVFGGGLGSGTDGIIVKGG